jgi:hypothetical protein
LIRRFFIEIGLRDKFLSYTNTLLKNNTFWFLAVDKKGIKPALISKRLACNYKH